LATTVSFSNLDPDKPSFILYQSRSYLACFITYRVIEKVVYSFKNLFCKKLLTLNHVLCTDGKEISQSSDLNLLPDAHTIILYSKGCYVQNGGKRIEESFLRAGIRQDNVSVKCATTFSETLWKESANQEVYL
jgi:hypothetical protein